MKLCTIRLCMSLTKFVGREHVVKLTTIFCHWWSIWVVQIEVSHSLQLLSLVNYILWNQDMPCLIWFMRNLEKIKDIAYNISYRMMRTTQKQTFWTVWLLKVQISLCLTHLDQDLPCLSFWKTFVGLGGIALNEHITSVLQFLKYTLFVNHVFAGSSRCFKCRDMGCRNRYEPIHGNRYKLTVVNNVDPDQTVHQSEQSD